MLHVNVVHHSHHQSTKLVGTLPPLDLDGTLTARASSTPMPEHVPRQPQTARELSRPQPHNGRLAPLRPSSTPQKTGPKPPKEVKKQRRRNSVTEGVRPNVDRSQFVRKRVYVGKGPNQSEAVTLAGRQQQQKDDVHKRKKSGDSLPLQPPSAYMHSTNLPRADCCVQRKECLSTEKNTDNSWNYSTSTTRTGTALFHAMSLSWLFVRPIRCLLLTLRCD